MKIIVVGGGAAGMMAAYHAANIGNQVLLLEKNEKLGKKIYITGKGRCNVTNAADMETLFGNINRNAKFCYSALYGFDNNAVYSFMEENGCSLKIERGDRVFPVSDHSSDVIKALSNALKKEKVEVMLNTTVKSLIIEENTVKGVLLSNQKKLLADKVILATGGISYPTTGSTGDGLRFAEWAGHSIEELRPSLVPIVTKESYIPKLQGLSLKNVELSLYVENKVLFKEMGEMLFTHFGISGPLVLSMSSVFTDLCKKGQKCQIKLDLKPALTNEQLDKRILRDFEAAQNKQFKNSLDALLPQKLIPVIVELSKIDPYKPVNVISKEERNRLCSIVKCMPITPVKCAPIEEAIITRGGVNVKEINSSTMESKLVKNLYFAGEMIDVDCMTGGFNLQFAWSTGYLAGACE